MARRFDVREKLVEQARDPACGWYRVRWAVEGCERCKWSAAKALADVFLGILKDAARDGRPLDPGDRAACPAQAGRGCRRYLVGACPGVRAGEMARPAPRNPAGRPPGRSQNGKGIVLADRAFWAGQAVGQPGWPCALSMRTPRTLSWATRCSWILTGTAG